MSSHPASLHKAENRSAGFTLPELLVVTALGIVLTGLTLPTGLRFYRAQLLEDTTMALQDALLRARVRAAAGRNGMAHGVRLAPGEVILFQGPSYAGRDAAYDEVIPYPSMFSVSTTLSDIVFSPLYATSSASGTIAVLGESSSATLRISGEGVIQIE